jgi:hypothetical protein
MAEVSIFKVKELAAGINGQSVVRASHEQEEEEEEEERAPPI